MSDYADQPVKGYRATWNGPRTVAAAPWSDDPVIVKVRPSPFHDMSGQDPGEAVDAELRTDVYMGTPVVVLGMKSGVVAVYRAQTRDAVFERYEDGQALFGVKE